MLGYFDRRQSSSAVLTSRHSHAMLSVLPLQHSVNAAIASGHLFFALVFMLHHTRTGLKLGRGGITRTDTRNTTGGEGWRSALGGSRGRGKSNARTMRHCPARASLSRACNPAGNMVKGNIHYNWAAA